MSAVNETDTETAAANLFEKYKDYITSEEFWMAAGEILLKALLIYLAARILIRVVNRAVERMIHIKSRTPIRLDRRRTQTVGKLLENVVSYSINFVALLLILGLFGINLWPLLAGASVVGLAIGFGAQSLVKDVITGFFIIFEDQFAVGDYIQIGSYKGVVEQIGLRVTKIRSDNGELHIIPNGSISQVTNYSLYNALVSVDLSVPSQVDLEKLTKMLEEAMEQLHETLHDLVTKPKVLGVQAFSNADVSLRIQAECRPNAHEHVKRVMNAEMRKVLERYHKESAKEAK